MEQLESVGKNDEKAKIRYKNQNERNYDLLQIRYSKKSKMMHAEQN